MDFTDNTVYESKCDGTREFENCKIYKPRMMRAQCCDDTDTRMPRASKGCLDIQMSPMLQAPMLQTQTSQTPVSKACPDTPRQNPALVRRNIRTGRQMISDQKDVGSVSSRSLVPWYSGVIFKSEYYNDVMKRLKSKGIELAMCAKNDALYEITFKYRTTLKTAKGYIETYYTTDKTGRTCKMQYWSEICIDYVLCNTKPMGANSVVISDKKYEDMAEIKYIRNRPWCMLTLCSDIYNKKE